AFIGLFAGYYRGAADTIFSSFADVMLVIPALAILITVSAYVRVVTVELMAMIVGLLSWPLSARVIRAQTLGLRQRLFVQVAKLSGENDFEIITRQILPNLTAYLAATFVGAVSGGILASVGLEVLGLGPQNVPTIGRTLFYAFKYTALLRGRAGARGKRRQLFSAARRTVGSGRRVRFGQDHHRAQPDAAAAGVSRDRRRRGGVGWHRPAAAFGTRDAPGAVCRHFPHSPG